MDSTVYPSYTLQANGPDETGISMIIQMEDGAAGPLAGMTQDSLINQIRALLDAQPNVTTVLSYAQVDVTNY